MAGPAGQKKHNYCDDNYRNEALVGRRCTLQREEELNSARISVRRPSFFMPSFGDASQSCAPAGHGNKRFPLRLTIMDI